MPGAAGYGTLREPGIEGLVALNTPPVPAPMHTVHWASDVSAQRMPPQGWVLLSLV